VDFQSFLLVTLETIMMKIILFSFLGLAALYGGFLLVAFFFQRRLQYFPTHRDLEGKGDDIFRPWRDRAGNFLGYVREGHSPTRVVMLFHGNGGEALDREWIAELAPDQDLVLILPEYPGYGGRTGSYSERTIYEAAEKAYDEAALQWTLPITVIGESLGSGVAAYLGGKRAVDRLALISAFSSLVDAAEIHYRYLPVRWLLQDRYDSAKHLSGRSIPLYLIHGTLDEIIPVGLARKLFEEYAGKAKKLTEVPGYGHNNIPSAIVDSPFADSFRRFVSGEERPN
jgi:uncharacterized protein